MSQAVKNVRINWTWVGDTDAIKKFRVSITKNGDSPINNSLAQALTEGSVNQHTFASLLLDTDIQYVGWVQAVYEGDDSDWVSSGGLIQADDGLDSLQTIGGTATQIGTNNELINQLSASINPNWSFRLRDSLGLPADIVVTGGSTSRSLISSGAASDGTLLMAPGSYAAVFPAIPINRRSKYNWAASARASAAIASGFSIVVYEATALFSVPPGWVGSNDVFGDQFNMVRSTRTVALQSSTSLTTSFFNRSGTYTPSPDATYVSFAIARDAGAGTAVIETDFLSVIEVLPTSLMELDQQAGQAVNNGLNVDGTIKAARVNALSFANGIEPVSLVNTLPNPIGYTGPKTVYLTTDSKLYRYTGTAWTASVPANDLTGRIITTQISDNAITTDKIVANAITTDKIVANAITTDKIVANAITAGQIAAAAVSTDKLAANAVTASKIFIGDLTNYLRNSDFSYDIVGQKADSWSGGVVVRDSTHPLFTGCPKARFATITVRDNVGQSIPCTPGEKFFVSCFARQASGNAHTFGLWVRWRDSSGGTIGFSIPFTAPFGTNSWTFFSGMVTAPATAAFIDAYPLVDSPAGIQVPGWAFAAPVIRRAVSGELVVDGAITADKIAANSITAEKIVAGSITADRLTIGAVSENMAQNGGFEAGSTAGWSVSQNSGSISSLTVTSADKTEGLYSGLVTKSSVANGVGFGCRPIPVNPGQTYKVSMKVRGASATSSGFFFRIYYSANKPSNEQFTDANGTSQDFVSNGSFSTTWTSYEFVWTCPPGVYWANVNFYNWVNGPLQSFHDDIRFSKQIAAVDIRDGTITAAKMTVGTITAESGILADAVITNAKIANLAVNTLKIGLNAVTIPVSAYTADPIAIPINLAYATLQTAVINSSGAPIQILYGFAGSAAGTNRNGPMLRIRLLRNGISIRETSYSAPAATQVGPGVTDPGSVSFNQIFPGLTDVPGQGVATYQLQAAFGNDQSSGSLNSRFLSLLEVKR